MKHSAEKMDEIGKFSFDAPVPQRSDYEHPDVFKATDICDFESGQINSSMVVQRLLEHELCEARHLRVYVRRGALSRAACVRQLSGRLL